MNLYDVLHRLTAREGPRDEAESLTFHDAIAAHAEGMADSEDYRRLREARADAGLEAQFKETSDAELTDLAADGDLAAQRERRRRAALASARKREPADPEAESKAAEPKAKAAARA